MNAKDGRCEGQIHHPLLAISLFLFPSSSPVQRPPSPVGRPSSPPPAQSEKSTVSAAASERVLQYRHLPTQLSPVWQPLIPVSADQNQPSLVWPWPWPTVVVVVLAAAAVWLVQRAPCCSSAGLFPSSSLGGPGQGRQRARAGGSSAPLGCSSFGWGGWGEGGEGRGPIIHGERRACLCLCLCFPAGQAGQSGRGIAGRAEG